MLPSTIDGVIARLEEIIRRSAAEGDRRGYFAALYNRVTRRVRDGIRRGEFEDGARMERLDVAFANRYLDAYDRFARGAHTTRPWRRAFDATAQGGLFVIQHLLLGMNAHIMLDLGIAAAEIAEGAGLAPLRGDFLRINDLLAADVDRVEAELVEVAGHWRPEVGALLGLLDRALHRTDETAASLLIDAARDRAWDFALRLADTPLPARPALIGLHEAATALVADAVLLGAPLVDLLTGGGSDDVAWNIRALAEGELVDLGSRSVPA